MAMEEVQLGSNSVFVVVITTTNFIMVVRGRKG